MAGIRRRRFLGSAALALPASIFVNAPQADSADNPAHHMKVTRIEALLLERAAELTVSGCRFPRSGV